MGGRGAGSGGRLATPRRPPLPDVDVGSKLDPPALPSHFFARAAADVARDLLGCMVVSRCGGERVCGRIVETEAYVGPEDPASHAAKRIGRTARNDPMFGPPGTAYIHMNYGIHWLLNVVTGEVGHPAAVLIRALEPIQGRAIMRARRGRPELTNGPARLTEALAVDPGASSATRSTVPRCG